MNVEDDTLKCLPTRQNRNGYPRKDNNCGDNSSKFISDDGNLWDTFIPENKHLGSNIIPENRDSFLSYLHITGTKYRIYSSKTYTSTKVTIKKMTESIKSNKILEVTYDKGVFHLLINIKCRMVVVIEPRP